MFISHFLRDKNKSALNMDDRSVSIKIANELISYLPKDPIKPIVFFCIGTDRSTGDSLGPLVGSHLLYKKLPANFYVHGTLDDPIHAINLSEKVNEINRFYNKPYIVAIDACLGQSSSVGTIQIKNGPLKPGAGVNKTLPPVGEIHITGIVNISGFMEFFVLQNTRLHLVMNLASVITEGIYRTGLLYDANRIPIDKNEENLI